MSPMDDQDQSQTQQGTDQTDPRIALLLALTQAGQGLGAGQGQGQTPQQAPAPVVQGQAPQVAPVPSPTPQTLDQGPQPPTSQSDVPSFIDKTSFVKTKGLGDESEQDKQNSLLQNSLLGFMTRSSMFGEPPKPETFDQYFRKTTSPAREFLANVLFGASAGLTGEKFRSVRAQKFEEFTSEKERQQKEQYQNMMIQTQRVKMIEDYLKSREQDTTKRFVAEATNSQKDEDRSLKAAQYAVQNNLNAQKVLEEQKNGEAKRREYLGSKDPYLNMGIDQAEAEFKQKGLDPWAEENRSAMLQRSIDLGNQIFNTHEQIKAANRPKTTPRPQRDRLVRIAVPTAYGIEYGAQDLDSGEIHGPSWWRKDGGSPVQDLTPTQRDRAEKFSAVRDKINSALNQFIASPKDVGSWANLIPAEYRPNITKGNRNAEILWQSAMNDMLYAASGAQINEKEMGRIKAGMPRLFENADRVVPGTMMLMNMLDAGQIRLKAGIDPSKIKLDEVYSDMENAAYQLIKQGKKFKPLSGDEIMEQAMKRAGYHSIRDNKGNIRDMEKDN